MAQDATGEEPLSGHLFVFRSRRGDRLKILYWDRDGFALWYKRLEKGTFIFPQTEGAPPDVSAADMAMILGGVDLSKVRRQKRYKSC